MLIKLSQPIRLATIVFFTIISTIVSMTPATGHPLAPSIMSVAESERGYVDIRWKSSTIGAQRNINGVSFRMIPDCAPIERPRRYQSEREIITAMRYDCGPGQLAGKTIRFQGLLENRHTIILKTHRNDGNATTYVVTSANASVLLGSDKQGPRDVWRDYLKLGMRHIAGGFDHLAFIFCLVLIAAGRLPRLFLLITTFTIAHSITLTLALLNIVRIPEGPVEALIAFSIVLMATRAFNMKNGDVEKSSFVEIAAIVFVFGLFHGLGFAGALSDAGLPKSARLTGLFSFNVGVEIGQVAFVFALYAIRMIYKRLHVSLAQYSNAALRLSQTSQHAMKICASIIGLISAYWLVQRSAAIIF